MIKKGTWVKITKTYMFAESKAKVGETSVGRLKFDLVEKNVIEFDKGDTANTSNISDIKKTEGGDYIVRTATSIYFVQVLR